MEQEDITQRCSRCGNQFPVLQMVMDPGGKGMTCRDCSGITLDDVKPRTPPKKAGKQHQYSCANCKFKFKSARGPANLLCGYCGSDQILTEKESGADALLKEATRKRFTDD